MTESLALRFGVGPSLPTDEDVVPAAGTPGSKKIMFGGKKGGLEGFGGFAGGLLKKIEVTKQKIREFDLHDFDERKLQEKVSKDSARDWKFDHHLAVMTSQENDQFVPFFKSTFKSVFINPLAHNDDSEADTIITTEHVVFKPDYDTDPLEGFKLSLEQQKQVMSAGNQRRKSFVSKSITMGSQIMKQQEEQKQMF